jgi:hypothetical protein
MTVDNRNDPPGQSQMVHLVTPTFATHYSNWAVRFFYICPG